MTRVSDKRHCAKDDSCPVCDPKEKCPLRTDMQLIRAVQEGSIGESKAAIGKLIENNYPVIMGILVDMGVLRSEAEDLAADISRILMDKVWNFEWRGVLFRNFVAKVTHNCLKEHYQKLKSDPLAWALSVDDEPLGDHDGALAQPWEQEEYDHFLFAEASEIQGLPGEKMPSATELDQILHKAIKSLPNKEADIIILIYFKGIKKSKEIADLMDLAPSSVRVYHQRALRKLSKNPYLTKHITEGDQSPR